MALILNRLTIRDEGEGRVAVYLRRAEQEFPKLGGDRLASILPDGVGGDQVILQIPTQVLPGRFVEREDERERIARSLSVLTPN
jgi:hypothetical protein